MKENIKMPELGKISQGVFNKIIYPNLGAKSKNVLSGPKHGVDCGIIKISKNKAMAVTCDPFFIVPDYGFKRAAWFAFHILASDIATSGFKPEYFSVDLNLPVSIKDEEFKIMWETVSEECKKYGVNIITGHTAKYEGCSYPMVGGAFMMATGNINKYITPQMACVGDLILVTKGIAIEASALMAISFKEKVKKVYGQKFADSCEDLFYQMSVLDDALLASSYGVRKNGVTSMHDATEYGLYGGLLEIANASKKGMRIYKEKIYIDERNKKICSLFDMDPYTSISEGTLILTVKEKHTEKLLKIFKENNINAFICGEIVEEKKGIKIIENNKEEELSPVKIDPFWYAFERERKLLA